MRAAGRRRGHRDDGISSIGSADRLPFDGAIVGEILDRHSPTRRLHRIGDLLRHPTAIEAGRALGGDGLEGRGEVVEGNVIARLFHRSVVAKKDARRRGMTGERPGGEGERIGDVVVDAQALPRERDRRRDQVGERELA